MVCEMGPGGDRTAAAAATRPAVLVPYLARHGWRLHGRRLGLPNPETLGAAAAKWDARSSGGRTRGSWALPGAIWVVSTDDVG